jgi:cysteinyl-tRNA synthetase
MDDDFNTAKAMGFLFEMSRAINSFVAGADKDSIISHTAIQEVLEIFIKLGDILGIFMDKQNDEKGVDQVIEILAQLRQIARNDKVFVLADKIRDYLKDLNIAVEDTSEGSRIRYEEVPDIDMLMKFLIEIREEFKKQKQYDKADFIRNTLKDNNLVLEDTKEGVRWKFVNA